MGKVRSHIEDDAEALAEWVARKLKNHDPMSDRAKVDKSDRRWAGERTTLNQENATVVYQTDDGGMYRITVETLEERPSRRTKERE